MYMGLLLADPWTTARTAALPGCCLMQKLNNPAHTFPHLMENMAIG